MTFRGQELEYTTAEELAEKNREVRKGFSRRNIDRSTTVPKMSVSSRNKYSLLSNEEMTETKKSEESGLKERPPAQIKILSRKKKVETAVKCESPPERVETTTKGKSPPGADQPKNVQSWINTVDPESTRWILNQHSGSLVYRVD